VTIKDGKIRIDLKDVSDVDRSRAETLGAATGRATPETPKAQKCS